MLKFGYITELNIDKGTVRVHFDDDEIVSNPLPVSVPASKEDKYSFPFSINEHVWCMMDDNCEFGVVGGAIYSSKDNPPNGASPNSIDIVIAATILHLKIDRQSGNLELKVKGNCNIEAEGNVNVKGINATVEASVEATVKGATVKIDSVATTMTGTLAVTGGITAASIAAGGFSGPGGGAMVASSDIQTSGDIKAGTVSLKLHKHTSATSGSPTSQPIP